MEESITYDFYPGQVLINKELDNDEEASVGRCNLATNSCCKRLRDAWKYRTYLERRLIPIAAGFGFCTIVTLLILLTFISSYASSKGALKKEADDSFNTTFCTSPSCVLTSASILSSMNPSIDPCQDFYEYSCGHWVDNNHIQQEEYLNRLAGENRIRSEEDLKSVFTRVYEDSMVTIRRSLEEHPEEAASEAERKVRVFYQSCLESRKSNESLVKSFVLEVNNLVSQIGGWPYLDSSNDPVINREWNIQRALEIVHNIINTDAFFEWHMMKDANGFRNKSDPRISIEHAEGVTLDRNYSSNTNLTSDEVKFSPDIIQKVILIFTNYTNQKEVKQLVEDIIDVETRIAQVAQTYSGFEAGTIAQLGHIAPFLDWQAFFQSSFSRVNITLEPSHPVSYPSGYLSAISKTVGKLMASDEGNLRLRSYLIWRIIRSLIPKRAYDLHMMLGDDLPSKGYDRNIQKMCLDDTVDQMKIAVTWSFMQRTLGASGEPVIKAMIASIKDSLTKNIEATDWMDDQSRSAFRDKINTSKNIIGLPKFLVSSEELDKFYSELKIESDGYLTNVARIRQFERLKEMIQYNETNDMPWKAHSPSGVAAFYYSLDNSFFLGSGILQNPFFDVSFPSALNFGRLGTIMGHELTHGLERIITVDSMDPTSNSLLSEVERFLCVTMQYLKYGSRFSTNRTLTLMEDIADNVGLKAAFHAFTNWMSYRDENLRTHRLPALDLTPQQMFFVGFAQMWCSSTPNDTIAIPTMTNDNHSPHRYRVIGPVSNMIEFATAFKCPLGSPMNPKNKCVVF